MPTSKPNATPDVAPAAGTPKAPEPEVAAAPFAAALRPASEASHPDVHVLLFERQAATGRGDREALDRIAAALAELGFA